MARRLARILIGVVLIAQIAGAATILVTQPPAADGIPIAGRSVVLVDRTGGYAGPLLERVHSGIGEAIGAVQRFWGPDWTREIVVVATGSPAAFAAEASLDPGQHWDDIAAVAVADEVDPAARRASGQRIILAPGAGTMSAGALQIVLTHELFHLAARADTAVDAPRRLTEGVGDFVARPPEPLPPNAAADPALPGDAELDRIGPARSAGYDRSWWFARFVADEYGVNALRGLYHRACGPGHPDFPAAVAGALGIDLAGLQARWARWLAGQGNRPVSSGGSLRGAASSTG